MLLGSHHPRDSGSIHGSRREVDTWPWTSSPKLRTAGGWCIRNKDGSRLLWVWVQESLQGVA